MPIRTHTLWSISGDTIIGEEQHPYSFSLAQQRQFTTFNSANARPEVRSSWFGRDTMQYIYAMAYGFDDVPDDEQIEAMDTVLKALRTLLPR